MTSFYSLPIELRNAVYDYALQDDHDFFADGVPALFKVCPEITQEIYSYRKTITTISINVDTPGDIEDEDLHRAMITKFKQKQNTKGLVVKFIILQRRSSQRMHDPYASIFETLSDGFTGVNVRLHATMLRLALNVETEVHKEAGQLS
ncbi:unnamed protein product [Aureobasidium mustum]|uniref:Uncharacterized protein n=1 Tax=Aureobasidium mustum TaxID=2773714 RepID=A0A9N8JTS2_9PEZI|nr:unnamed protein product [Aureobasidium mustum]